jgi:hypothetical protein
VCQKSKLIGEIIIMSSYFHATRRIWRVLNSNVASAISTLCTMVPQNLRIVQCSNSIHGSTLETRLTG